MDTPAASGPGNLAIPPSLGVTSHTLNVAGGDVDYDQTIKIKSPGSGMMAFNRYKLDRVLGRGGMGVVWLAEDTKLERPVALKFLPSLIGLDPAAVKELKTETRRGLELSHPHIVRIYDFVDDEDAAAISMEFVDGKTLSELRMTTEHGVFSVDDVSKWLLGVCDALDYAHFQRKLIHRDLKPANIMLAGTDAIAKIADFGIARSLSDTMSRLSAAHIGTSGTLPYMSPQQAMGERPMPTDDVYSLGATIYELLSGKPPFYRGDLPTQINSKIPPTMLERRQELEINAKEFVPKVWEDAIAACLHKEPEMRPSCAGALAEMLGLKPLTVTVRTGAYAAANARAAVENKKTHTPLIAAAATMIIGVGAAAYFFLGQTAQENKTPALVNTAPATNGPEKVSPPEPKAEEPKSEPTMVAAPAAPETPPVAIAPQVQAVATAPQPMTNKPIGNGLSLEPDPATATQGALANMTPAQIPPLPPGVTLPPDGSALIQPDVPQPESGFWTLEQVFPSLPHSNYSLKGKHYLLYKTQSELKQKGFYTSVVDGEEGKGTHNAIVLFQVRNGLVANGLLDLPTLAALELSAEEDKPEWALKSTASGSTGKKKRNSTKEESGFFQKTGDTLKRLNPFGK